MCLAGRQLRVRHRYKEQHNAWSWLISLCCASRFSKYERPEQNRPDIPVGPFSHRNASPSPLMRVVVGMTVRVLLRVVRRLADPIAAPGAVRPIFPGAPGLRRSRRIGFAAAAGSDLTLG